MKWIFVLFFTLGFFGFLSMPVLANSGEVSGTVTMSKELEKNLTPMGALFIIARKAGVNAAGAPPLAALKIPQPKFPQHFVIGAQNSMMGGKFEGPLTISARYSATGDALDKSGPQATAPKSVQPGKVDLKIELKKL